MKLALITGASRGIGKATLLSLAQTGIPVIGTATTAAGAEKITTELAAQNLPGQGMQLQVEESSSIAALFSAIEEKYNTLPTILVNNAGVTRDNLFLRMTDEEWEKTLNTNLTGVYHLTKACIRHMIKQRWGRIIQISSVSAFMGNPGQVNYAASKAALVGFSKSLATEIAARGITCNVVAPGFIETDMTNILPEAQKKQLLERIPMKRIGHPEEIAEMIIFLASEKSSYITGQTFHVNGGLYMD